MSAPGKKIAAVRVHGRYQAHIRHFQPMHGLALQFLKGYNLAGFYAGSHISAGTARGGQIYGSVFYASLAYFLVARAFAYHGGQPQFYKHRRVSVHAAACRGAAGADWIAKGAGAGPV